MLPKCFLCKITPKINYHYEMCTFIHQQPHRKRKHCKFFQPGCNDCLFSVGYGEKTQAKLNFCLSCSNSINVIRKEKYMLYFYSDDIDGPGPKPKDLHFIVHCNNCLLEIIRSENNFLTVNISFCIVCSNSFIKITRGKNALYFY